MHDLVSEAKVVMEQIEVIHNASWKGLDERSVVYGVAQYLNDAIHSSGMAKEEKGALVSTIVNTIIEMNRADLALFNALKKSLLDSQEGIATLIH